jgi:uncharacterized protein
MPHFRIFLYTAQALLLSAHLLLYIFAVRYFRITGVLPRVALAVVLAVLSVSFLLSSYLAHLHDNEFTRAYYFFGGFWLGLFLYLLMAAVCAALVIGVSRLLGHGLPMGPVAGVLACAALLFSVYGVWNAFHPKVTEVSVTMKGLPQAWKGKTIVQLSDVHLGHVFRADFLEKVVKMVDSLHPDVVAITGDLFDGMDGDLEGLALPLKGLHAPDGIYFVTGNHETYLGVERAYAVLKGTGVTILNDRVVELGGLQLAGISYRRRGAKPPADIMRALAGYIPGRPTVLLYHSPVGVEEARKAGVGLQLSGHTHKGQLWPFNFVTARIYDGLDYGLHRFGDYSIYTTNGVGAWGPPMRTGNTPEIVRITLE